MVLTLRDVDLPGKAFIMPVVKLPAILIGLGRSVRIRLRNNLSIGHGNRKCHCVVDSEVQILT